MTHFTLQMKIEIGLGRRKNRTKTESKVASLKTRIYKDHLSQLPTDLCRFSELFRSGPIPKIGFSNFSGSGLKKI